MEQVRVRRKMVYRIFFSILFCLLSVSCERTRFRDRNPSFENITGHGRLDYVPLDQRCSRDEACRRACEKIYRNTADIDQCVNLHINDVKDLYKVAVYLEKPINRDLRTIREHEFAIFVEVGTQPLNDYVERYTISESKRVLAWIAEENRIARVLFALGPREYRRILINLFRSTDPLVAEEALHNGLSRGDTFYKICNDRNNDYAVYMVHQVIIEDLCETRLDYISLDLYELREACVIRIYCHMHGEKYIHAPDFKYISRVIEYEDIFDYIREEDLDIGLNINQDELTSRVCDRVCGFFPDSCS